MSKNDNTPNKLIGSSSPYLLQHAHNPVDWQTWGDEAWSEAKEKNRLVLISIGYSTCHWCHVMEKESFEDYETAEIMNMGMVSIKVDREERPDIDMVYMDACQLMTGKGGWPLNVICLPDGRPIYAGTYFPKPQWQQLLIQLTTQYRSDPEKFEEYGSKLHEEMKKMNGKAKPVEMDYNRKKSYDIFQTFATDIDWNEGGKQRVPKFMVPIQFEYALDFHLCTGDEAAKDYIQLSLLKMANGGIYDHLRGGFYRYSTDGKWFAPHFEKMLYDNAQLIKLYSRAAAWLSAENFQSIAEQSIVFCTRELKSKDGGFFSGLDADSEGQEGRFYTFTERELRDALNEDEFKWIQCFSNIQPNGNWEANLNIVHSHLAPLQVLDHLQITADEFHKLRSSVFNKLFKIQDKRERPSLDYKIITSWNGLMLQGLSSAGLYLNNPNYVKEATELGYWLFEKVWDGATLYRIYSQGKRHTPGFLDDYASVTLGCLQLFKATQDERWIEKAQIILNRSIELFWDGNTFSYISNESEPLIISKSDNTDDVIPSANAMITESLNALFLHFAEPRYKEIFKSQIQANTAFFEQYPGWYAGWARLHLMESCGDAHIGISPELPFPNPTEIAQWPSWITLGRIDPKSKINWLKGPNKAGYYLCSGNHCYDGVNDWSQVQELLEELYGGNIEG